jgi:hypothetical protein
MMFRVVGFLGVLWLLLAWLLFSLLVIDARDTTLHKSRTGCMLVAFLGLSPGRPQQPLLKVRFPSSWWEILSSSSS